MVHFWLFLSARFCDKYFQCWRHAQWHLFSEDIFQGDASHVLLIVHSPQMVRLETRRNPQANFLLFACLSLMIFLENSCGSMDLGWPFPGHKNLHMSVQKKVYQWVKWLSRGGITALCSLSFSARVIHVPQSFLIRRLRTRGMLPLKQSEMPEVKPKVKAMPKVKAPWEYSKSVLEFLLDFCWLLLQYSASVWIGYVSGLNLWSRRFRKCQRKENSGNGVILDKICYAS